MVGRKSIITNTNITENQEIVKNHRRKKNKDHIFDVPNKYPEKPHHCVRPTLRSTNYLCLIFTLVRHSLMGYNLLKSDKCKILTLPREEARFFSGNVLMIRIELCYTSTWVSKYVDFCHWKQGFVHLKYTSKFCATYA